MADRDRAKVNANEVEQKQNRDTEHPQRPEADPEGPGGRNESKGEADARNKTTRRGER